MKAHAGRTTNHQLLPAGRAHLIAEMPARSPGRVREDAVMRVRFAGSGDAFGSGGRWQTCIHVSGGGQVLLVDCGATSLVALEAQGLDPRTVDAVAVTHLHGDHFGGLPFLILDGQFSRRTTPLPVAGPPGIRARLAAAMEALFPGSSQARRRFPVEVTELGTDGHAGDLGAATVRGWEVEHACGAPPLALRVEAGRRELRLLRRHGVDPGAGRGGAGTALFAVEAYTFDRPVRYHLDYQTLRRPSRRARRRPDRAHPHVGYHAGPTGRRRPWPPPTTE